MKHIYNSLSRTKLVQSNQTFQEQDENNSYPWPLFPTFYSAEGPTFSPNALSSSSPAAQKFMDFIQTGKII